MTETSRLERSQRAQSAVALSASMTPLAGGPTTHAQATRPRSMSYSHQESFFLTSYNTRGFDALEDPFQSLVGDAGPPLGMHRRRLGKADTAAQGSTSVGKRSSSCRVEESDELWTRLGAKSSAFGGWNAGDGRVEEWSTRWGGGGARKEPDDSEGEDDDDVRERHWGANNNNHALRLPHTRPGSAPIARTQSSLSVFHDSFEEEQESIVTSPRSSISYFPSPVSSPAMSRNHSRHHSLSHSSPRSSLSSLPPCSPVLPQSALFVTEEPKDGGTIDALAHSFLMTQQDAYGLFARVEAWLEWPWASTTTEPSPSATVPPTPAISRVASTYSLGSMSPATPSLEHSTWSESGELSAYRRARSMAELASKLEWEHDDREGGERALERDGLAAFVDVLAGLGGFL